MTAGQIYKQEGARLQQAITGLLEIHSSQKNLSSIVEPLVKNKQVDDQWRIYQRMYYLCLSDAFKGRLDETLKNGQGKTVKLKKMWADELMARYNAVQTSLLETSNGFLSAQCVADALIQWRRLDLLRQCRTMESAKLAPKTCHQLLKRAGLLLESNLKKWTIQKEDQVFAILKAAASIMDLQLTRPDSLMKQVFFQRVGMCSQDWATCTDCKSIYPSVRFNSCPSVDCTLKQLSLSS